jgi:hypothetical protein
MRTLAEFLVFFKPKPNLALVINSYLFERFVVTAAQNISITILHEAVCQLLLHLTDFAKT